MLPAERSGANSEAATIARGTAGARGERHAGPVLSLRQGAGARTRAPGPLDFQFDQTSDGRVLKLLNVVDEYTREALAVVAARSMTADAAASHAGAARGAAGQRCRGTCAATTGLN